MTCRSIRLCYQSEFYQIKKNITAFNRDLKALHKKIRKKVFFNFKENEAIERYQKFNSTEFNLEPDIKEFFPGCLRDIHSVEWICQKCLEIDSIKKLKMDIFNRSDEVIKTPLVG